LQGQASEWALLKRHASEDCFGVQICGSHADAVARCVQLLDDTIEADFIDINMGCPIDLVRLSLALRLVAAGGFASSCCVVPCAAVQPPCARVPGRA